jgi:hypothetical protein
MGKRIHGPRSFSDEAIRKGTGKSQAEWNAILDEFGAKERGHAKTAAHLRDHYKVRPWWAQALTARYEWDRGIKKGK